MECLRTLVTMDKDFKLSALLDCGAEVNITTCKIIVTASLIMRKGPRLELVTHTDHHCPFVKVCENMAINMGGLVIQTLVFIVETANHFLVLGQLFLYKNKFSQQYLAKNMYGYLIDYTDNNTVVFLMLGTNDWANWKKKSFSIPAFKSLRQRLQNQIFSNATTVFTAAATISCIFQPSSKFTGSYCMSQVFDNFSLHQTLFQFQVNIAYKRKTDKMKPVDTSQTDSSKLGGNVNW